jgi:hypothetical protein
MRPRSRPTEITLCSHIVCSVLIMMYDHDQEAPVEESLRVLLCDVVLRGLYDEARPVAASARAALVSPLLIAPVSEPPRRTTPCSAEPRGRLAQPSLSSSSSAAAAAGGGGRRALLVGWQRRLRELLRGLPRTLRSEEVCYLLMRP